jgi:diadenosine tetraphosphate (Ap4A) HIT family hydrolase
MDCPFCKREKLEDRVFYEDDKWIAFLAAPYHTNGHCILAAKPTKQDRSPLCPRVDVLGWGILECFSTALVLVADFLMQHYQPKDILFSSVRGDINHFHCHLIPFWDKEERVWRKEHSYERGHLFEYLGYLEKTGDEAAKRERVKMGWDTEQQRNAISKKLQPAVKTLRLLTGYCKA